MTEFDNLTFLHGKPGGSGILKASPEDFVVVEDLASSQTAKVSIFWYEF